MSENSVWRAVILGYVLLHALLRLTHGSALYWDEAEALFHARRLEWGYGPQPPLYFWLQWGVFRLLGEGRLAVILLRDAVLAGALLALFGLLSREAGPRIAGVSVLLLGLFPVFSWTTQTFLTHSVLAFLCAVLVTGAMLRLMRAPSRPAALTLGVLLGLGTLSKLNFVLWPLALVLAALLLPEWRARLRPGLLALALLPAGLLVAPYALWAALNPAMAGASLDSLGLARDGGLDAAADGLLALAQALAAFGGLCRARPHSRRADRPRAAPDPARTELRPLARLLLMALVCTVLLIGFAVLAGGVTNLRERWFLPVGWALAPWLAIRLWPALEQRGQRALMVLGGGAWAVGLAAFAMLPLVDPGRAMTDFRPLAERVGAWQAAGLPVLVDGAITGGNLRLAAPGLDLHLADPGRWPSGSFLLVMEGQGACLQDLPLRIAQADQVFVPRGDEREPFRLCVIGAG
ncbi:4-amino-4-deoxy-L-arabinose transferase [Rubellimicrobium thermophilum DSM 16684]|uniref:4-amino-4-deoxy-L-arabinose transferase n=1 Tax=Rubellimicrobium thermophilum DSM 16684 TaxID=1123069 RepID=S9S7J1_9RHOB|nr:glycosyltransferase family 39 protein [Rubellimicrobium thermophilum]EPX86135.1 4-amino-4-deoxy-L-arabinose transferase [Rubellimicrobium thermophilum DSM 16684]